MKNRLFPLKCNENPRKQAIIGIFGPEIAFRLNRAVAAAGIAMAGGSDFRTRSGRAGGARVGPDRWGSELGRTGGGQSWAAPVGQSHRISSMLV